MAAASDPAWYRNLVAHPDVTVELRTVAGIVKRFSATAATARGAERQRLLGVLETSRVRLSRAGHPGSRLEQVAAPDEVIRHEPGPSDVLVLAAVGLAGLGYAEGAALAREYGGWRVICWALVLAAPILAPATALALVLHPPQHVTIAALAGLGYVSAISMFLGFFAWYAGLARGGVARVGRLQLVQPVLTLGWSVLLLGEHISIATAIAAVIVLATVTVGRKARVDQTLPAHRAAPEPPTEPPRNKEVRT